MAAEALAIEAEDARSAGALGFMARILVQVGLPHSEREDDAFLRRNGNLSFCITAHPDVGLPYGRYPRLLLIWMTGEAVRTKSPLLQLGPTLSGFMAELGLIPAGGRQPVSQSRPRTPGLQDGHRRRQDHGHGDDHCLADHQRRPAAGEQALHPRFPVGLVDD